MKIDSSGTAVAGSPPGVSSTFSDGPSGAGVKLGSTSSGAPEVPVGSGHPYEAFSTFELSAQEGSSRGTSVKGFLKK